MCALCGGVVGICVFMYIIYLNRFINFIYANIYNTIQVEMEMINNIRAIFDGIDGRRILRENNPPPPCLTHEYVMRCVMLSSVKLMETEERLSTDGRASGALATVFSQFPPQLESFPWRPRNHCFGHQHLHQVCMMENCQYANFNNITDFVKRCGSSVWLQ